MTNPYAGAIGYNNAVDDACRAVVRVLDEKAAGEAHMMEIGVSIIVAISGLRRTPRQRRRSWRTPTVTEIVDGETRT